MKKQGASILKIFLDNIHDICLCHRPSQESEKREGLDTSPAYGTGANIEDAEERDAVILGSISTGFIMPTLAFSLYPWEDTRV